MQRAVGVMCLLVPMLLCGCSGAGSSSGGSGSTGSGGTTSGGTDMGTLAAVSDSSSFTLTNAASNMVLGISGQSQTAGANAVQESSATTTADMNWHVLPMDNSEYNIENMLTHQVLGINNAATTSGAQAVQWADNGTNDHLWEFYQLTDGNYLIKNANSGLYLEDANSGTTASATIDQGARSSTSAGCSCQEWKLTAGTSPAYSAPMSVNVSYTAPDSQAIGIHDPSILKVGMNYYLFSTHALIYGHTSGDRASFADSGNAISALPTWTNAYTTASADLWAPDASAHNGAYWLYYAASTFGSANSAIGLAISSSGTPGTYVDTGAAVYTSSDCAGSNAIDPASVVDASGNAWLAFGSYSNGIHIVPVNNATGIPTGAACTLLAYHPSATGLEGSYIYQRGGYYYLFASVDGCCRGTSSTYRIIVGRSTSVTGPYTDRGGVALTQGGGTIVLSAHSNINGPGGESVFHDTDGDVLVYHYYDGNNNGDPALGMNLLGWTPDGWPYVQ